MKAEHGFRRDADPLAGNAAEHQRAGRKARPVDDDAAPPDCFTRAKKSRYSPTEPPPLEMMRTSAIAGTTESESEGGDERRAAGQTCLRVQTLIET